MLSIIIIIISIVIITITIIIIIIIIIIIMPKRAAKFAKRASCEIRYLELYNRITEPKNGGSVEWRNVLRRGMTEYRKSRNAVLYEKNVSKNEIAIK